MLEFGRNKTTLRKVLQTRFDQNPKDGLIRILQNGTVDNVVGMNGSPTTEMKTSCVSLGVYLFYCLP